MYSKIVIIIVLMDVILFIALIFLIISIVKDIKKLERDGRYYSDGENEYYEEFDDFPFPGEPDKIYIDNSTNDKYRWSESLNKYIPKRR